MEMTNIIIDCSNCGNLGHEQRVDMFEPLESCAKCGGQSILAALRFYFPFHDLNGELYKEYISTACESLSKHPNYRLARALEKTVQQHKDYFESYKNRFTYASKVNEMFNDCQSMIQKLP